jgi:hypothetical protein
MKSGLMSHLSIFKEISPFSGSTTLCLALIAIENAQTSIKIDEKNFMSEANPTTN